MACVVLPSETARLVYGYLVKEKLDSIALQFLENSPYLTDCYHIVKSGFHFNTKLFYRELHELIQEYSTTQNLVNKKIGTLSKTSILYKKIKLQCETLPEIVDLLLFWSYNIVKSSGESENDESKRSNHTETKVNEIHESVTENNYESAAHEPEDSELVNSLSHDEGVVCDNRTGSCESPRQTFAPSDSYSTNNNCLDGIENSNCSVENITQTDVVNVVSNDDLHAETTLTENHDKNGELLKDVGHEINIGLNEVNALSADKTNSPEIPLIPRGQVNDESEVKIVRIEKETEGAQKNQLTNAFSEQLDIMGSNMNAENGSVLYVSPDVGNLTINQDQNQFILIPIDYYKSQPNVDSVIESNGQQVHIQELVLNEEKNFSVSNNLILEDVTPGTNSITMTSSSVTGSHTTAPAKNLYSDDCVVTEGTYLQNREIIYELESEIKPQIIQEINSMTVFGPRPAAVAPTKYRKPTAARYRRILPRRAKRVEVNPVIVVQPLVESNSVVMCCNKTSVDSNHVCEKKTVKRILPQKRNPSVETPEIGEDLKNETDENKAAFKSAEEAKKENSNIEKICEEKENVATTEKKTETPVVFKKKNSKRLSLSTPRRRSHIRALEFETPPKTKTEKKKSKTSPKAKGEEIKVKNQSVRNTLFKSPDSDSVFKTPSCFKSEKKTSPNSSASNQSGELHGVVPLDSDSPCEKEPGESVTDAKGTKKSWDSDLRYFISSSISSGGTENETKRISKVKKGKKNNKKPVKKNTSQTQAKGTHVTPSPSKMGLTAKRNTYSISCNEEGSPVRSLLEELDLVTPFKDVEPVRSAEETPMTKLFRENINGIDIDLSMITTPVFPPTPSIIITPDVEESGLGGTFYYSPRKDKGPKDDLLKIEEYVHSEAEQTKKDSKESHDRVIGELVSKAKEIVGLKLEGCDEHAVKKPPSGKVLSMVKIQMITQCDKKLCENIPINEEPPPVQEVPKFDLKCELEEKRKRALEKIKTVKENLTARKKVTRSSKRKRNEEVTSGAKKPKLDESDEKHTEKKPIHSTPISDRSGSQRFGSDDSVERIDPVMLEEIREEFPPFQDTGESPELPLKTRKKLHFIRYFLKLDEVIKFFEARKENKSAKLELKRAHRKFFQVFYKWLKHPHGREVNSSEETKLMFREYKQIFETIRKGLSGGESDKFEEGAHPTTVSSQCQLSDDDGELKQNRDSFKKKEEDVEDGPVSILPLKKRKASVRPPEMNGEPLSETAKPEENPSRTQTFLQDIDVDRFLSQIHGQENR